MMLTVSGLPPDITMATLRKMIQQGCRIEHVILEEREERGPRGEKTVTVGCEDAADAVEVVRRFDGVQLGPFQIKVTLLQSKKELAMQYDMFMVPPRQSDNECDMEVETPPWLQRRQNELDGINQEVSVFMNEFTLSDKEQCVGLKPLYQSGEPLRPDIQLSPVAYPIQTESATRHSSVPSHEFDICSDRESRQLTSSRFTQSRPEMQRQSRRKSIEERHGPGKNIEKNRDRSPVYRWSRNKPERGEINRDRDKRGGHNHREIGNHRDDRDRDQRRYRDNDRHHGHNNDHSYNRGLSHLGGEQYYDDEGFNNRGREKNSCLRMNLDASRPNAFSNGGQESTRSPFGQLNESCDNTSLYNRDSLSPYRDVSDKMDISLDDYCAPVPQHSRTKRPPDGQSNVVPPPKISRLDISARFIPKLNEPSPNKSINKIQFQNPTNPLSVESYSNIELPVQAKMVPILSHPFHEMNLSSLVQQFSEPGPNVPQKLHTDTLPNKADLFYAESIQHPLLLHDNPVTKMTFINSETVPTIQLFPRKPVPNNPLIHSKPVVSDPSKQFTSKQTQKLPTPTRNLSKPVPKMTPTPKPKSGSIHVPPKTIGGLILDPKQNGMLQNSIFKIMQDMFSSRPYSKKNVKPEYVSVIDLLKAVLHDRMIVIMRTEKPTGEAILMSMYRAKYPATQDRETIKVLLGKKGKEDAFAVDRMLMDTPWTRPLHPIDNIDAIAKFNIRTAAVKGADAFVTHCLKIQPTKTLPYPDRCIYNQCKLMAFKRIIELVKERRMSQVTSTECRTMLETVYARKEGAFIRDAINTYGNSKGVQSNGEFLHTLKAKQSAQDLKANETQTILQTLAADKNTVKQTTDITKKKKHKATNSEFLQYAWAVAAHLALCLYGYNEKREVDPIEKPVFNKLKKIFFTRLEKIVPDSEKNISFGRLVDIYRARFPQSTDKQAVAEAIENINNNESRYKGMLCGFAKGHMMPAQLIVINKASAIITVIMLDNTALGYHSLSMQERKLYIPLVERVKDQVTSIMKTELEKKETLYTVDQIRQLYCAKYPGGKDRLFLDVLVAEYNEYHTDDPYRGSFYNKRTTSEAFTTRISIRTLFVKLSLVGRVFEETAGLYEVPDRCDTLPLRKAVVDGLRRIIGDRLTEMKFGLISCREMIARYRAKYPLEGDLALMDTVARVKMKKFAYEDKPNADTSQLGVWTCRVAESLVWEAMYPVEQLWRTQAGEPQIREVLKTATMQRMHGVLQNEEREPRSVRELRAAYRRVYSSKYDAEAALDLRKRISQIRSGEECRKKRVHVPPCNIDEIVMNADDLEDY